MIDENNIYVQTLCDNKYTIKVVKMSKAHNNNWQCTLYYNDDILMINTITKKQTITETPNEKLMAKLHRISQELCFILAVFSSLNRERMIPRLREFGFTKV